MPPAKSATRKKQEKLAKEVKEIRKGSKKNLRCADCNARATPYVCLNFNSFVCSDCAGVHRSFTHRVKSIAVAVFSKEEVESLREGGNKNCNAHYLGKYKKGRDTYTLPREGERDKIKAFIKYKYIDKKWYSEKGKRKHHSKHHRHESDGDDSGGGGNTSDDGPRTTPKRAPSSRRASKRTSRKLEKKDMPSSSVNNEKRDSITAADEDLLSFGPSKSSSAMNPIAESQKTGDDDWFGGSSDPWGDAPATAGPSQTAQAKSKTGPSAMDDPWGDSNLWGDNGTSSTTTATISQPAPPSHASGGTGQVSLGMGDLFSSGPTSGAPATAISQAPADDFWGGGGTTTSTATTTTQTGGMSGLMGALTSLNNSAKTAAEAKRAEEAKVKAVEADPFADLMGDVEQPPPPVTGVPAKTQPMTTGFSPGFTGLTGGGGASSPPGMGMMMGGTVQPMSAMPMAGYGQPTGGMPVGMGVVAGTGANGGGLWGGVPVQPNRGGPAPGGYGAGNLWGETPAAQPNYGGGGAYGQPMAPATNYWDTGAGGGGAPATGGSANPFR